MAGFAGRCCKLGRRVPHNLALLRYRVSGDIALADVSEANKLVMFRSTIFVGRYTPEYENTRVKM